MATKYFTSDLHFYHKNIIRFCKRPYSGTDEMIDGLLKNIKEKTKRGDIIYSLGDMFLESKKRLETIEKIEQLERTFINIKGNHDSSDNPFTICDFLILHKIFGQETISLAHKPSNEFENKEIFKTLGIKIHICGHVHSLWKSAYDESLDVINVNVGVDVWNYSPVSCGELSTYIQWCINNKDKLQKVRPYRNTSGIIDNVIIQQNL